MSIIEEIPHTFDLSNCSGLQAAYRMATPLFPPSPRPSTWEPNEGAAVSLNVVFLECDHLSLGRLERGPVKILLETHDHMMTPSECRIDNQGPLGILASIWADDAEVVDYLRQTVGAPAILGTFSVTRDQQTATYIGGLEWNATGKPKSTIALTEARPLETTFDTDVRLFWARGDGLGMADFVWSSRHARYSGQPVESDFAEPMLFADSVTSTGVAAFLDGASPSAGLSYFGDQLCELPLSD